MRATWKHYRVTLLVLSANSYTVSVNRVRLFILRETIGRIHNVHNWWRANVCSVECVMTVLATDVIAKRTCKVARAC